jgi:hypothetical protein
LAGASGAQTRSRAKISTQVYTPEILRYDPTPADDNDTVNAVMNNTFTLDNAVSKQLDADTLLMPIVLE